MNFDSARGHDQIGELRTVGRFVEINAFDRVPFSAIAGHSAGLHRVAFAGFLEFALRVLRAIVLLPLDFLKRAVASKSQRAAFV